MSDRVAILLHLVAAAAVVACREHVVEGPAVDPVVVRLLEEVVAADSWTYVDGEIVSPPAALALLEKGAAAVPTLLAWLTTADANERDWVIEFLGRIGDPRAREPIERLLREGPVEAAGSALEALARLRQPGSIPLVRGLLASQDRRGLSRAELLAALVELGDHAAIGELIALAMADPTAGFDASGALLRIPELRIVLGYPPREPTAWPSLESVMEESLFFKAAQEWWLEKNGQPSPWRRDPAFRFREPFAAEKEAALESVTKAADLPGTAVRVLPVDVDATSFGSHPVVAQYGWGHGSGIVLAVIEPTQEGARLHRFVGLLDGWDPEPRSAEASRYLRATADAPALAKLFVGIRTALAARVEPWWSGPEGGFTWTSQDYVVTLCGVEAADSTIGFCGNHGSEELALQARVMAARDCWIRFENAADWQAAEVDDAAREVLAAAWRRAVQLQSAMDWWVRERMAYVAAELGVRALALPLLELVTRRDELLGDREVDWGSLVRLTGVDFRRRKGAPRCTFEIERDYRALLGR